jgi:hypothetical protein
VVWPVEQRHCPVARNTDITLVANSYREHFTGDLLKVSKDAGLNKALSTSLTRERDEGRMGEGVVIGLCRSSYKVCLGQSLWGYDLTKNTVKLIFCTQIAVVTLSNISKLP